jgi:tetratricopeptide (TPR) repeat protein
MLANTGVEKIVFARIYCFLILPVLILTTVVSLVLDWQISLFGLIAITMALNLIPTILVLLFSNKVGDASAILFKGTGRSTIRDQYCGNISQARYLKTRHEYKEALELIEQYLDKDPDFAEALYLKAQILLDGFNDYIGAKLCTNKILQLTDNTCSWHQWAMSLQKEIYKRRRQQNQS